MARDNVARYPITPYPQLTLAIGKFIIDTDKELTTDKLI